MPVAVSFSHRTEWKLRVHAQVAAEARHYVGGWCPGAVSFSHRTEWKLRVHARVAAER